MVSDVALSPQDHIVVAYPFDGLVLAPIIKRIAGCSYTVLVHDLHKDALDRDEVKAGLAGAAVILSVSDSLAELMQTYNSNSQVLYPSPGEPLGHAPAFSKGPVALAGGFDAQYLVLAKKLGLPIVAIGDDPGSNLTGVRFIPRFAENDDAISFVADNCSAVVVIVPDGHADYASHSFPSKLLDFARAGLPIVIIAPQESPVGRWAKQRDWPLFIHEERNAIAFDRVAAILADEVHWLDAQRRVLAAGAGEFSADVIHGQLLDHVNSATS